eukprot:SAG31_NODE_738_length_12447_cov_4.809848_5_plen_95_part_00
MDKLSSSFEKHAEQMAAIKAGFERLQTKWAALGDADAARDGGRSDALRQVDIEDSMVAQRESPARMFHSCNTTMQPTPAPPALNQVCTVCTPPG